VRFCHCRQPAHTRAPTCAQPAAALAAYSLLRTACCRTAYCSTACCSTACSSTTCCHTARPAASAEQSAPAQSTAAQPAATQSNADIYSIIHGDGGLTTYYSTAMCRHAGALNSPARRYCRSAPSVSPLSVYLAWHKVLLPESSSVLCTRLQVRSGGVCKSVSRPRSSEPKSTPRCLAPQVTSERTSPGGRGLREKSTRFPPMMPILALSHEQGRWIRDFLPSRRSSLRGKAAESTGRSN
jgi:hypothetical protein